ncbi:MAG: hypothetical protein IJ622_06010 [Bacteroidales bacterium]|nr:hypothetical protein [Bacteroidales bacterium]
MDFKERHFSIDPGKGKKMDGCPYSTFEDGRDVEDYIIPPKGYVFVGFKFDPEASNQIYDGKLIAEYEKETFNEVVRSNLWKILLAVGIVAIIAIVAILAANVFKEPKPAKTFENEPKNETVASPVDTTKNDVETAEPEPIDAPDTTAEQPVQETNAVEQPSQEAPQPVDGPTAQFKHDFWNLVHQRTIMMDPYHDLFNNNKGQVSGEEYDYLRFTILENTPAFKEWTGKLRKIPATEIESINTIDELVKKLKEYN